MKRLFTLLFGRFYKRQSKPVKLYMKQAGTEWKEVVCRPEETLYKTTLIHESKEDLSALNNYPGWLFKNDSV